MNENKLFVQLLSASRGGDHATVKLIVATPMPYDQLKGMLEKSSSDGETSLHAAVDNGHAECVKALVEAGADVNKGDIIGRTPLQKASYRGHTECIIALVAGGADCEKESSGTMAKLEGRTLVHCAAEAGLLAKMNDLLKQGKIRDLNKGDDRGRTPAYLAATKQVKNGFRNPCLDSLIFEHDALFLSIKAAKLGDIEKIVRLLEIAGLAAIVGFYMYEYLKVGGRLSTTCDTFFGGMLLQPYLFDFVTVFAFKMVQYVFEEMLAPGVSFLAFWFWLRVKAHYASRAASESRSTEARPSQEYSLEAIQLEMMSAAGSTNDEESGAQSRSMPSGQSFSRRVSVSAAVSAATSAAASAVVYSSVASLDDDGSNSDVSATITLSSRLLYFLFGMDVVREWRKEKYLNASKNDPKYKGKDFWYQVPYLFLYLQVTTAFISVIVAAVDVDRTLPAWQQYTNIYAVVVNSGVPTTVFSMLKMALIDKKMEQMLENPGLGWIWLVLGFLVLVLVPPIFSHILPAAVLYCWIVAPYVAISYLVRVVWKEFVSEHQNFPSLNCIFCGARRVFQEYHIDLFVEIYFRFLFIFIFHTLYNWASLVYIQPIPMSGSAYIGVLVDDFHLRSQTMCFLAQATQSSRGMVTLFGWF